MKYKTLGALVLAASLGFGGCAKLSNTIDRDGSFFGSTKAPYVVVKQSGGRITDVYKLDDAMVQSETQSDGWLFTDQYGNAVNISGDAKIIRLNSTKSELWDKYHEYHMEWETKTYENMYAQQGK